jgi:rod shape-determining protein MreC
VISIVMMAFDYRFEQMERLRGALSVAIYPLQYLVNVPEKIIEWASVELEARQTLLRENALLRQENLYLKTHSQKFAAVQSENKRLRELLDSAKDSGERVLMAEVVAMDAKESSHQVVLDKGSQDGVYLGQPIIDANGVMGQVVHVNPVSSTGLLVTDASHAIPVKVNRNGVRAIASGGGANDKLELMHVPVNADVKKGDLLVSSGLDGRFPAGYPVGEIVDVEHGSGEPYARISAKPSAEFSHPQEVLLVWPMRDPIAVGSLSLLSGKKHGDDESAKQ